jgi:transcriptional regulator with XRE-family HTH domain
VRPELAKTIGQAIARWRTAHAMTQEELAVALDVDPMTVSRFERGVSLPSLLTFQQIATVFGASMAQMLEDVPVPVPLPAPATAGDNSAMLASLMKNLSPEEQAFFIETLKRYRALVRRQRNMARRSKPEKRPDFPAQGA